MAPVRQSWILFEDCSVVQRGVEVVLKSGDFVEQGLGPACCHERRARLTEASESWKKFAGSAMQTRDIVVFCVR